MTTQEITQGDNIFYNGNLLKLITSLAHQSRFLKSTFLNTY